MGNGIVKALVTLKNNTRIKQADEIRSTFVANVSHELRSPLHHSSVLSRPVRGGKDDPEARKNSSVMETEASRMSRLIDDLCLCRVLRSMNMFSPETQLA